MAGTSSSRSRFGKYVRRFGAAVFVATGIALLVLGILLLLVGGSLYYALAGAMVVIAGVFLWNADRRGAWIYGLMLVCTIVWALWEVGLDGWALTPRLLAPAVLGLWLLTPCAYRDDGARNARGGRLAMVAAVLAPFLILVVAGFTPSSQGVLAGGAATDNTDAAAGPSAGPGDGDWLHYGNDEGGQRYSPLAQISPQNVARLENAWSYRTHMVSRSKISTFEATPLKVGDSLYFCDANNEVIALDAESGKQRWRFDPKTDLSAVFMSMCRGVAYYETPDAPVDAPCAERIITATLDGRLLAVDARSGKLCQGFGDKGFVNLLDKVGAKEDGYYSVTSAPQVVRGKIVVGANIPDNEHISEPSGVIRAYDAVTGAFSWAFDAGRPDEHGLPPEGKTFTLGTPNSWAPISADEKLGMVYLPTGNATPDWYGGHRRPFDDKYSSAVVALNAETGAVVWSFQTVHHDLWDYDVASQPTLYDFPVDGRRVPALIQATKRGEIFVLDRRTGRPLTKVVEKPVPRSNVVGEKASLTQPFSVEIPSVAGPDLTEAMMWGVTPFDQAWCRIQFRRARYQGTMTPFSVGKPSISYPGFLGGVDWGGVSVDTSRDIMIVNSNHVANYGMLITRAQADREGLKPMGQGGSHGPGAVAPQAGTPYGVHYGPFLSPLGAPCNQPPYGTLTAIDMKTRKILWSKPFGTARDTGPMGIASHIPLRMGVPNTGGSLVTRSGLVFISATQDRYLRAYDIRTGQEVWKARLPAGGQATPMTYLSKSGRQYVVIAAGGHGGFGTKIGDYVLAYALPSAAVQ